MKRSVALASLGALLTGASPALAEATPCVESVVVARILSSTYLGTPEVAPEPGDASPPIPWLSWSRWRIEVQQAVAGQPTGPRLEVYALRHADYNPSVARHILMILTRAEDGKVHARHSMIVERRRGAFVSKDGQPVAAVAEAAMRETGLAFCPAANPPAG